MEESGEEADAAPTEGGGAIKSISSGKGRLMRRRKEGRAEKLSCGCCSTKESDFSREEYEDVCEVGRTVRGAKGITSSEAAEEEEDERGNFFGSA